jgi:hypothetical protein
VISGEASCSSMHVLINRKAPMRWSQYFWMKDFSGSGSTGAPSGVKVGGTRNGGLWVQLSYGIRTVFTPLRRRTAATHNGGEAGDLTITVVFQLALLIRRGIACAIEHAPSSGTSTSQ